MHLPIPIHQLISTRILHLTGRNEAEHILTTRLQRFQDYPCTLVLAFPRGSVEVRLMVRTQPKLPLDTLLNRNLSDSDHSEYVMGAINETGYT